ncbi:MAG: hypothetical protein AAGB01_10815, partial [Cyanobacteria bacterium P01_F01_bin.42]
RQQVWFLIGMDSVNRVSPMTTYYLRKLVESRLPNLGWKCLYPACDLPHNFLDSVTTRVRNISYPSVLERLVSVHRTLCLRERTGTTHIQGIELQIYELLGLEHRAEPNAYVVDPDLTPQKYRSLLGKVYGIVKRIGTLISPKVTRAYFQQLDPQTSPQINTKKKEPRLTQHRLQPATRFNVYEKWISPLGNRWEREQTPALNERTWFRLRQSVNIANFIATTPSPRRSDDLLRFLNSLSQECSSVFGCLRIRYYLLESRPEQEWCYSFIISDKNAITYCGNSRETITNVQFGFFGEWIEQFWQRCESYRSEVLLA